MPEARSLGRYRLESLLGRGGMAEVWRAADTRLGRTVAVKVIHATHASDRAFVERFLREARVVASLEHPNILPVYDFGEEGGLPFLVMPYLDGGTLRDRMPGRPVPLPQATAWIGQLAGALDAAHEAGVLHRDVKPANVLIGKGDRLFLADFGIAKLLEGESGLTATGMVVGTPLYMAPEQAQGKPATPATDRYALAVIAYELLAGEPPFQGENPLSLMHQHVTDPAPALSAKVRGLPGGLDSVLGTALSKNPAARPPTCRALADAIAMFLPTGSSAAAAPTEVWPGSAPRTGQAKGTAPSAPPATVSSSPPLAPAVRPVATPPPGLTSEETVVTPSGGRRRLMRLAGAGAVAVAAGVAGIVLLRGRESAAPNEALTVPAPSSVPATSPLRETPVPSPAGGAVPSPQAVGTDPDAGRLVALEGRLKEAEAKIAAAAVPRALPIEAPVPSPTAAALTPEETLAAAFLRLDAVRRPARRLSREDFEFARDAARRLMKERPENPEARYLDAYAGGGLEYVSGRDAVAGQAFLDAFLELKRYGRREVKRLAFLVRRPNGGFRAPEGWELALAYGDARGEAEGFLDAARAKHPDDARVLVGLAGLRRLQGREPEARELLRAACQKGLAEACREAGVPASNAPFRRRPPGGS